MNLNINVSNFKIDDITVVYEGIVMKSSSWMNYKTRRLVLNSNRFTIKLKREL